MLNGIHNILERYKQFRMMILASRCLGARPGEYPELREKVAAELTDFLENGTTPEKVEAINGLAHVLSNHEYSAKIAGVSDRSSWVHEAILTKLQSTALSTKEFAKAVFTSLNRIHSLATLGKIIAKNIEFLKSPMSRIILFYSLLILLGRVGKVLIYLTIIIGAPVLLILHSNIDPKIAAVGLLFLASAWALIASLKRTGVYTSGFLASILICSLLFLVRNSNNKDENNPQPRGSNALMLWDLDSQVKIVSPDSSARSVFSVAFSPDGRTLAWGEWYEIELSDLGGWKWPLRGYTGLVLSIAFSPDGRMLASGSANDDSVRVWDLHTQEQIMAFEHTRPVWSVAFSPGGKTLASASSDNTVRLWDLDKKKQIAELKGHTDQVRNVAFSADGKLLASASLDGTVRIWDPDACKEVNRFTDSSAVLSVAFSPDGEILATGSKAGKVHLLDQNTILGQTTIRKSYELEGNGDPIYSLAFSPNSLVLAYGSQDSLHLMNIVSKDSLHLMNKIGGYIGPVWSIAFAPDSRTLATGSGYFRLSLNDNVPEEAKIAGYLLLILIVVMWPVVLIRMSDQSENYLHYNMDLPHFYIEIAKRGWVAFTPPIFASLIFVYVMFDRGDNNIGIIVAAMFAVITITGLLAIGVLRFIHYGNIYASLASNARMHPNADFGFKILDYLRSAAPIIYKNKAIHLIEMIQSPPRQQFRRWLKLLQEITALQQPEWRVPYNTKDLLWRSFVELERRYLKHSEQEMVK